MSEMLNSSLKKMKLINNVFRLSRMSLSKGKKVGPYEIIDLLKEGSSSKIYLAKSKITNEYVSIKAISKSPLRNNNLDDLLLITKQIETLKILKHRNIVTLYEIYESKKNIYLVTEYISGKDLIEKIIKKKRFNEEQAKKIFFQLLDALSYMHKMNICHRNLRTEHILFDKNNRPKIVGFGYSSFYESDKPIEGAYGSLCYACPEIIDEIPYNPELADVWSLGVILYVLTCGYLPFSDEDDNKNKILISQGIIDFPKEISNKLKDLLKHMLEKNPKKRYNFQKIVKHPWIKPYTEKIFSKGINIHKTIFPVDERILNIINEFGLDKTKVKNDLIVNKYNIGTSIYKQMERKLLDLKFKNVSDLWSEEFVAYRDDEKNKYKDGNKKYEEFIMNVDKRYKNKEDFINAFKAREDMIVERLLYLKEKRDEENEKQKNKLNIIEEAIIDDGEEDNDLYEKNKSDNENELKENDLDSINIDNIRTVKTERYKSFPRRMNINSINFGKLMKIEKNNNISKNKDNLNKNLLNKKNDDVQIVYNKDQDEDILQKFQEEQIKKYSENIDIIIENPKHEKVPSAPDLINNIYHKNTFLYQMNSFRLSLSPEKNQNLPQKILEKKQSSNSKEGTTSISSYNNNSLYNNIYSKNSLYSYAPNNDNRKDSNEDYHKSTISDNTLFYYNNGNKNTTYESSFRMTKVRKSNNKSYLARGSLYDNILKKSHPDNIRKTTTKKSLFNNLANINKNEEIKEKKNFEKQNKKNNIQKSSNYELKYSLSFDDDDDDEEEEEGENEDEFNPNIKEEDIKLLNILDNENDDDELMELKKMYYKGNKNEKVKKEENIDEEKNTKINNEEIIENLNIDKTLNSNLNSFSRANTLIEEFNKYEEKLNEINKNYQINDKEENENLGSSRIRFDSQFEIIVQDDIFDKYK